MVLPTRLRAAHYSALIFLSATLMLGSPLTAHADTPAQRQELAAALRQLDALERFIAQSASRAPTVPGERYHFDYPRLLDDLARVRTGIQFHLSPSRAQPRDATALSSHYRQESVSERSNVSPEGQP
ncbi:RAQPRD family integrative conjugative element protein [Pectobacterium aroidearum]|uniref:RAQPRD family integrative conjugative element protein n=1 Tax=Pectobacterium aroidearum TaxID=1201031 RepID=A0ABR5ZHS2_9GAMM|nr:RAQPRD family integrative conjugative element protein [Pectobacterium aroidearum]MBA5201372.1 RAQPRD family integrative conjugative element protein [Pectobacterium aroidearum]MBA5234130.1 RAQPRD family integrative conjugative element protein [Pectobacterium aroidearum]MBA5739322.1 RAQPRD family integrative conjugative element protein [Pectobacterium aroidearum]